MDTSEIKIPAHQANTLPLLDHFHEFFIEKGKQDQKEEPNSVNLNSEEAYSANSDSENSSDDDLSDNSSDQSSENDFIVYD